jgi:hypothetical protein
MNTAFGNPKGNPLNIDVQRIRKQCLSIPDEVGELMIALGADEALIKAAVTHLKWVAAQADDTAFNLENTRDALCDINVFSYGAHHLMGIDADADMKAVVDGVMTRFVKDEGDRSASMEKHAAYGVTSVYFEGNFPTMVMKSAHDQPDAPKGKFLKSASFKDTVFPSISVTTPEDLNGVHAGH